MDFSEIKVGDIATFDQSYSLDDFKEFSSLSKDNNLLHHDKEYAIRSGFSGPIVPIHLVSLPLSRIAGMIFPGESSLYLNKSIEAINHVYYEDILNYSAYVKRKSESNKSLDISVICFNKTQNNVLDKSHIKINDSFSSIII